MNCFHCDRSAHPTCKFCGRAVCKEHIQTAPSIVSLFKGDEEGQKAVVIPDAVWCGVCTLREEPVSLPELK
jgi:hypothetical protein